MVVMFVKLIEMLKNFIITGEYDNDEIIYNFNEIEYEDDEIN